MYFDQPYSSALGEEESGPVGRRLAAHTAWIAHVLWEAFQFGPPNVVEPRWWEEPRPRWIAGLEDLVPSSADWIWITRENPNWEYLVAGDNSVSIVRLDRDSREALDQLWAFYRPKPVTFAGHYIFSEHGLVNSVPAELVEKGTEIISRIDGSVGVDDLIIIPIESHCIFIGERTIVALAGQFDANRYNQLRVEWEAANAKQAAVFLADVRWTWSTPVNPARFEELVEAILSEEPGFEWVRAAGPAFERDQGRDLVALWVTPPGLPGGDVHFETAVRKRKVVIQVKSRKKSVGKSDVRDVRDTIERHDADGFFLVAHPGWSNDLFNYCESLARRGIWVDLWGPMHMEQRLRARPYIAQRFADVVRRAE
nr:restriction endonuclease [Rhizobium leguminosarum]